MFLKANHKSAGVTLVELLIALGIVGGISLVIATFLSQQQQTVKLLKQRLQIRTIARTLDQTLSNPANLLTSTSAANLVDASQTVIQGNYLLSNCINSVANAKALGTNCTLPATDPQQQQSFNLYQSTTLVAGTTSTPVVYRLADGSLCVNGAGTDPMCNLQAVAYFWATCAPQDILGSMQSVSSGGAINISPGPNANGVANKAGNPNYPPTVCLQAQTIHLRYQIRYVPNLKASNIASGIYATGAPPPNYPSDDVFWADYPANQQPSTFGAISIPVSQIPVPASAPLACAPNFQMTGIVNGVPTCQCLPPFELAPGCVPGQPCACINTTSQCPSDTRFNGVDVNGQVICCNVNCNTFVPIDWSPPVQQPTGYFWAQCAFGLDTCFSSFRCTDGNGNPATCIGPPMVGITGSGGNVVMCPDPPSSPASYFSFSPSGDCFGVWGSPVSTPSNGTGCNTASGFGWIEAIQLQQPPVMSGQNTGNSCVAESQCILGKYGGSCSAPVSCREQYTCCVEDTSVTGCSSQPY